MPRRKGETAEDRSYRKLQEYQNAKIESKKAEVMRVLLHPEVLVATYEYFQTSGVFARHPPEKAKLAIKDGEACEVPGSPKGAKKEGKMKAAEERCQLACTSAPTVRLLVFSKANCSRGCIVLSLMRVRRLTEFALDDLQFDKNVRRWGCLPVGALQALLHHVEPSTFNPLVLRSLCPRGAWKRNQALLCTYVEFVANIDPQSAVGEGMRTTRLMGELLTERYHSLHRRGRDLVIPTDWASQGIYSMKKVDGKPHISHRFNKTSVVVDEYFPPAATFELSNNYSEFGAKLTETTLGRFSELVPALFAKYASPRTPPREPKAIKQKQVVAEEGKRSPKRKAESGPKPQVSLTPLGAAIAKRSAQGKQQSSFRPTPPPKKAKV
eukprot:1032421-Amphidinium_carterae.2